MVYTSSAEGREWKKGQSTFILRCDFAIYEIQGRDKNCRGVYLHPAIVHLSYSRLVCASIGREHGSQLAFSIARLSRSHLYRLNQRRRQTEGDNVVQEAGDAIRGRILESAILDKTWVI